MTKYEENSIYTTSFIKKFIRDQNGHLTFGTPCMFDKYSVKNVNVLLDVISSPQSHPNSSTTSLLDLVSIFMSRNITITTMRKYI